MNTEQSKPQQAKDSTEEFHIRLSVFPQSGSVSSAEAIFSAIDTRKLEIIDDLLDDFKTGLDGDAVQDLEQLQMLSEIQALMFSKVCNLANTNYYAQISH